MQGQVIIVDDEKDALVEYQEFMELSGFDCLVESDPERAFDTILANACIKVVVTDLRMPRLNGAELIERLLVNLPDDRKLHCLIVSGYGDGKLTANIPDVPVLNKPVDLGELTGFLRDALNG